MTPSQRLLDWEFMMNHSELAELDKKRIQKLIEYAKTLEERNLKMREALEFYGDIRNYDITKYGPTLVHMISDLGKKAHKALEETKDDS